MTKPVQNYIPKKYTGVKAEQTNRFRIDVPADLTSESYKQPLWISTAEPVPGYSSPPLDSSNRMGAQNTKEPTKTNIEVQYKSTKNQYKNKK